MKFKFDENLPEVASEYFRSEGFDVTTVLQEGLKGHPDHDIASVCQHENRALVTLDLDFSDIRTYPPRDFPGILVLRPKRQSRDQVMGLLKHVVRHLTVESVAGKLWIVERSGIRIREPE